MGAFRARVSVPEYPGRLAGFQNWRYPGVESGHRVLISWQQKMSAPDLVRTRKNPLRLQAARPLTFQDTIFIDTSPSHTVSCRHDPGGM